MRKQTAFTLIELLVAISILAILIGLGVVAFSSINKSAQEKQTRAQMEVLRLMLSNYHDASEQNPLGGGDYTYPDTYAGHPRGLVAPQLVVDGHGNARFGDAVEETARVVNTLRRVHRNASTYEQIGADKLLKDADGNIWPVLVDAWNNPMIYVPAKGLDEVEIHGTRYLITSLGRLSAGTDAGSEARPFWASAGPDGDFSKGDDNLYSFEN